MYGAIGIILIFVLFWILKELLNYKIRNTLTLDSRGYLRNGFGRLIHRDIAYRFLYNFPHQHPLRFSEYQIHHKDLNKLNNAIENLEILTPQQHKKVHGII